MSTKIYGQGIGESPLLSTLSLSTLPNVMKTHVLWPPRESCRVFVQNNNFEVGERGLANGGSEVVLNPIPLLSRCPAHTVEGEEWDEAVERLVLSRNSPETKTLVFVRL